MCGGGTTSHNNQGPHITIHNPQATRSAVVVRPGHTSVFLRAAFVYAYTNIQEQPADPAVRNLLSLQSLNW